jgi:hypothetical protein
VTEALLGFDVARSVDAGSAIDGAAVSSASAPAQTAVATVRLHQPGALTVTVEAASANGVAPTPVPGSANEGAVATEKGFIWELPDAAPGDFEFSALFTPNPEPGWVGQFEPKVTVSLRRTTTRLEALGSDIDLPLPIELVTTALLPQRVTPIQGPPAIAADDLMVAEGEPGVPQNFMALQHLEGRGAYNSTALGDVTGGFGDIPFNEIAPGAGLGANTAASSYTDLFVTGQRKSDAEFHVTGTDEQWTGMSFSMSTAEATRGEAANPAAVAAPGVAGGTIWDGDVIGTALEASLARVSTDSTTFSLGQGHIVDGWSGETNEGWSYTYANAAPYAEPNTLNPTVPLKQITSPILDGPSSKWNRLNWISAHTTSLVVPWFSRDGHIDNRSGSSDIQGSPVEIKTLRGMQPVTWLLQTIWPTVSKFALDSPFDDAGITITPKVRPGGYLLESSGQGFERDWSPVTFYRATTVRVGEPIPEMRSTNFIVVPPGTRNSIVVGLASGRVVKRTLGAGSWQITVGPDRVNVGRVLSGFVGE